MHSLSTILLIECPSGSHWHFPWVLLKPLLHLTQTSSYMQIWQYGSEHFTHVPKIDTFRSYSQSAQ